MPSENFIKNITSKDINLSKETIKNMIKSANYADFCELCEKSDFIFPFLKDRIIKDFVKLVEEKDLNTIFEFSKIYCSDFEDMIVNSWLKYASQDLTDDILNLFEQGTPEQKAYGAKYFVHIQDSLAIEYLYKEINNDFEPLKINIAKALRAFNDVKILNEMKEVSKISKDEFEKLSAFNFIVAYGGKEQIKFVLDNCFSSPFLINILSNVLDFYELDFLKEILDENVLSKILYSIIEEYPEELSLDSILYWQILDFMKLIYSYKNQYAKNILLIAKNKFEEFSQNDIYTFDLDKNTKNEVKNISNYLNSIELNYDNLESELEFYFDKQRFNVCIDVINEFKLEKYLPNLAKLINEKKLDYEQMTKVALVLKNLGNIDLINIDVINDIENINIRELIKSYF